MAANYSYTSRATDAAGSLTIPNPGNAVAIKAPAEAAVTVRDRGGDRIPVSAFPLVRLTCGAFAELTVEWAAHPDGTLHVLTGDDLDVGMLP